GEPEIQDLHVAARRDEQVLGLEIAVHDSLRVRGGEARACLDRIVDRLAWGNRAAREHLADILAVEELRHDVGKSVSGSEVVDREDVRMIELSGRARFLLETAETIGVSRE